MEVAKRFAELISDDKKMLDQNKIKRFCLASTDTETANRIYDGKYRTGRGFIRERERDN